MKCYSINFTLKNNDQLLCYDSIENDKPIILFGSHLNNFIEKAGINIQKIGNTDITGMSFYRYPKLTLPRNKTDLLKEKYNVQITRNPETANYKVVSESFVESIFTYKYRNVVLVSELLAYLNANMSYVSNNLINVVSTLEPDAYVTLNGRIGWSYNTSKAREIYNNMPVYNKSQAVYSIDDEALYSELLNSTNLVLDVELSSKCNEDSVILTEEEYESILTMISSEDKVNHAMALELMSNCNVEESLDIIALIYYNNFDRLKEASNWHSVNVKSLRKRLSEFTPHAGNRYHSVDFYDRFFKKLGKENMLTEFAFKLMSKKMTDETMIRLGFNNESVFDFGVNDIKLKPEFYNKLKRKYSNQTAGASILNDFIEEEETTLF